jgi:aldose sugar dehydrogenase
MKKNLLVCLFVFGCTTTNWAQPINEKAGIAQTVEMYFDGWATGDSTKIGKAMHSTCHLKFYRDSVFTDMDRATYLSRFKLHERNKNLVTRIVLMDVTENIASVKTEIITEKDVFTDYFNLIKTMAGWFIVDKVSVRKPK